jgi:hypothetical protein
MDLKKTQATVRDGPTAKKNRCLGEPVDNGEDDVFVVDAQETFNEIHGHISSKRDWYLWWL